MSFYKANICAALICTFAIGAFGFGSPALAQSTNNDAVSTSSRARDTAPLSYEQIIERLRAPIIAIPSVRGITTYPEDKAMISIFAARKIDIRLENLFNILNRPRANRQRELQKFVNIIRDSIQKNDPFKPEALRIIIRETGALNEFETQTAINETNNLIVRRVLVGDIEEVIVADSPTSIAIMPIGRLKDLNLEKDSAFELARKNTLDYAQITRWAQKDGLLEARLDGAYEASLFGLPEVWNNIETHLGGPIAAIIPNRGSVYVGRADKPEDIQKLNALANQFAAGPFAISKKIYLRQNNNWIVR